MMAALLETLDEDTGGDGEEDAEAEEVHADRIVHRHREGDRDRTDQVATRSQQVIQRAYGEPAPSGAIWGGGGEGGGGSGRAGGGGGG